MGGGLLLLAAAALAPDCYATAHLVSAGTVLVEGDVTPVECRTEAPRPAIRYDRAGGVLVAADALPAGSYLGRLAPLAGEGVAQGAALTLRSRSGPVTIERRVVAMQPGRPGGKLFVRDAGGQVFAVVLELEGGQ